MSSLDLTIYKRIFIYYSGILELSNNAAPLGLSDLASSSSRQCSITHAYACDVTDLELGLTPGKHILLFSGLVIYTLFDLSIYQTIMAGSPNVNLPDEVSSALCTNKALVSQGLILAVQLDLHRQLLFILARAVSLRQSSMTSMASGGDSAGIGSGESFR